MLLPSYLHLDCRLMKCKATIQSIMKKDSCSTTIQWSIKGHLYQGQNQTFTNYYVKNYYVIYCCLDSFIDYKNDWWSSGKFFVAITQTVVMVDWSKCSYAPVINISTSFNKYNIVWIQMQSCTTVFLLCIEKFIDYINFVHIRFKIVVNTEFLLDQDIFQWFIWN